MNCYRKLIVITKGVNNQSNRLATGRRSAPGLPCYDAKEDKFHGRSSDSSVVALTMATMPARTA